MMHFKQTEIGEIPEDWESNQISEVCEKPQYGYTSSSGYNVLGPKYLRITDIQNDSVNWKIVPNCEISKDELSTYILKDGDIVFARTGATTGKSFLVSKPPEAVFASFLIRLKSHKIDPAFLAQIFKSALYWSQIHELKGDIVRGGINGTILRQLYVPKPPLPEQKKIAAVLTTADGAIEKTNEIIEQSKQVKKGLMQELLTRGIGHKKFKETKVGEIPEEWELVPLGELVNKMASGGTPLISVKDYYGGDIPFAKIEDLTRTQKYVKQTEITLSDRGIENSAAWIVPTYSVLYSIYATLGEARIAAMPMATNQAILAIIPKEEKLTHEFLFYYLSSLKGKLAKYHKETTQKNLTKHAVKSFQIPLPSLLEQKKIAAVLTTADAKIESEVQKRGQFETLKKGLMQDLLTGGVRFPDFVKVS